jgi:hypothetical protein
MSQLKFIMEWKIKTSILKGNLLQTETYYVAANIYYPHLGFSITECKQSPENFCNQVRKSNKRQKGF